ncbi:MAG: hypothetical protein IJC48_09065 [Clostridia bacterium]|nr:hypothetical protein [Clostridia bacterium]
MSYDDSVHNYDTRYQAAALMKEAFEKQLYEKGFQPENLRVKAQYLAKTNSSGSSGMSKLVFALIFIIGGLLLMISGETFLGVFGTMLLIVGCIMFIKTVTKNSKSTIAMNSLVIYAMEHPDMTIDAIIDEVVGC